jgi:hypothetical protein
VIRPHFTLPTYGLETDFESPAKLIYVITFTSNSNSQKEFIMLFSGRSKDFFEKICPCNVNKKDEKTNQWTRCLDARCEVV